VRDALAPPFDVVIDGVSERTHETISALTRTLKLHLGTFFGRETL
jgi:hypothetical protein